MKSNIKRLSLCLSALMLLILASPLTVLAAEEEVAASAKFYGTFWSLVPPLVAIALALITKEVYSSLFVGILVGALFYSNFNFEGTILHIFEGGMISVLTDSYNMDENIDTGMVDENDMKPVVDGPEDGDLGADTGSTDTPAAE